MIHPHGLCFLDNYHLVVCNRKSDVSIFKIPSIGNKPEKHNIEPVKTINGKGFLFAKVKSPGSVDSYKIADNRYKIFVCNNYWHMVTSHIIELGDPVKIENEGVLIEEGTKIPDGICLSPDRKWIAVTNHVNGEVLIYKNDSNLNRNQSPIAVLNGSVCPHGVRFSSDGNRLYVADASSPYLFIYKSEDGSWDKISNPSKAIKVLNDETFYLGRYAAREGGIKGIDLDSSNSLFVSTHKDQVLAFYDLKKLSEEDSKVNTEEIYMLCHQRDQS